MEFPTVRGGEATGDSVSLPDHAIVAPVDRRQFRRSLGLVSEQTSYALRVDDGRRVGGVAEALTDGAARRLESVLSELPTPRRPAVARTARHVPARPRDGAFRWP